MRRLESTRDSEQVVANTLHNIRERYERSTSNENNLSHSQRLDVFNRYASYEILAHWLAYELPNEFHLGYTICNILDEDGVPRYYHPIKVLTKHPGLLAFILIPYDATNQNSRVHVSFVGTSNLAGIIRDLEYGGAGQESFLLEKEGILQQINDMVATVYARTIKKIKLTISGHSLGGSDAQNCAAAIIQAMAHNMDDNFFGFLYESKLPARVRKDLSCIEEIHIAHLNSAGVSQAIAEQCNIDAKVLKSCSEVKLYMHALMVKNDLIQATGQARIFANADPRVVKVEVLNFALRQNVNYTPATILKMLTYMLSNVFYSIGYSRDMAQAHSAIHFAQAGESDIVEYYNNQSIDGREKVKAYLSERSNFDNSSPVYAAKTLLHCALKTYNGL